MLSSVAAARAVTKIGTWTERIAFIANLVVMYNSVGRRTMAALWRGFYLAQQRSRFCANCCAAANFQKQRFAQRSWAKNFFSRRIRSLLTEFSARLFLRGFSTPLTFIRAQGLKGLNNFIRIEWRLLFRRPVPL